MPNKQPTPEQAQLIKGLILEVNTLLCDIMNDSHAAGDLIQALSDVGVHVNTYCDLDLNVNYFDVEALLKMEGPVGDIARKCLSSSARTPTNTEASGTGVAYITEEDLKMLSAMNIRMEE